MSAGKPLFQGGSHLIISPCYRSVHARPASRPSWYDCRTASVISGPATSSATTMPAAPTSATPFPHLVFRFSAPSTASTIPTERTTLHMSVLLFCNFTAGGMAAPTGLRRCLSQVYFLQAVTEDCCQERLLSRKTAVTEDCRQGGLGSRPAAEPPGQLAGRMLHPHAWGEPPH